MLRSRFLCWLAQVHLIKVEPVTDHNQVPQHGIGVARDYLKLQQRRVLLLNTCVYVWLILITMSLDGTRSELVRRVHSVRTSTYFPRAVVCACVLAKPCRSSGAHHVCCAGSVRKLLQLKQGWVQTSAPLPYVHAVLAPTTTTCYSC